MTKWIKRIAIVLLVLIVGLFLAATWILKEAFGPKHKTVTINLDNEDTLICKETYSADMAAVFYDVDFTLQKKNKETVFLGAATFPTEDWEKDIQLYTVNNWHILSAMGHSYSKLLMVNPLLNKQIDTVFSPLELRYDNQWKSTTHDIPSRVYRGTSTIDTLVSDKLQVSYQYRIGEYPPFKFYTQSLHYTIDTTTGDIITTKVLERIENNSNGVGYAN